MEVKNTPNNKAEEQQTVVQKSLEWAWSVTTNGDPRLPCKYFIGVASHRQGDFYEDFSCELRWDREVNARECSTSNCYSYEPFEPSLLRDGYCCYFNRDVYHIMRYIYSMRWGVTLCGRLVDARTNGEIYGSDKQFKYERLCAYCGGVLSRLDDKGS